MVDPSLDHAYPRPARPWLRAGGGRAVGSWLVVAMAAEAVDGCARIHHLAMVATKGWLRDGGCGVGRLVNALWKEC
jgi:hypothetical protein